MKSEYSSTTRQREHAARSQRFREALLWCGDALGGKGDPEMDRIFKLIADAEAELATVVEFDDEADLRRLRGVLPMVRGGKMIIYRRRGSGRRGY